MRLTFFVILFAVLAVDLISKWLTVGVYESVIPGFISIHSNEGSLNTGSARGLGSNWSWFGYAVSVFAVVLSIIGIVFFLRAKKKSK